MTLIYFSVCNSKIYEEFIYRRLYGYRLSMHYKIGVLQPQGYSLLSQRWMENGGAQNTRSTIYSNSEHKTLALQSTVSQSTKHSPYHLQYLDNGAQNTHPTIYSISGHKTLALPSAYCIAYKMLTSS